MNAPAQVMCRHYACQCARREELAQMGRTVEALEIDRDTRVRCRMTSQAGEGAPTAPDPKGR